MVKDHSAREETRCRHMGCSFRLAGRVLLYASSHRQGSTYHGLCYSSRGAQVGTRNSSMGPPHEGSIRRPISPWTNALTTELHLAPLYRLTFINRKIAISDWLHFEGIPFGAIRHPMRIPYTSQSIGNLTRLAFAISVTGNFNNTCRKSVKLFIFAIKDAV